MMIPTVRYLVLNDNSFEFSVADIGYWGIRTPEGEIVGDVQLIERATFDENMKQVPVPTIKVSLMSSFVNKEAPRTIKLTCFNPHNHVIESWPVMVKVDQIKFWRQVEPERRNYSRITFIDGSTLDVYEKYDHIQKLIEGN